MLHYSTFFLNEIYGTKKNSTQPCTILTYNYVEILTKCPHLNFNSTFLFIFLLEVVLKF